MTPNPFPPPSTQLHHIEALARVGEYVQVVCALVPYTHTTPSAKTIATFHHFHPLVEIDIPPFVDDFNPKMDLVLDRKAFIFVLTHSPRLSSNSPLNMVYELLRYCFVPDDFASGFDLFLEICEHITCGHVPPLVSHLFVAK
jgi:hypothetical protein